MPIGAKLMERWFAGRLNYSAVPATSSRKSIRKASRTRLTCTIQPR
ncbi:hypothetical protein [Paraburkholderia atlantica]